MPTTQHPHPQSPRNSPSSQTSPPKSVSKSSPKPSQLRKKSYSKSFKRPSQATELSWRELPKFTPSSTPHMRAGRKPYGSITRAVVEGRNRAAAAVKISGISGGIFDSGLIFLSWGMRVRFLGLFWSLRWGKRGGGLRRFWGGGRLLCDEWVAWVELVWRAGVFEVSGGKELSIHSSGRAYCESLGFFHCFVDYYDSFLRITPAISNIREYLDYCSKLLIIKVSRCLLSLWEMRKLSFISGEIVLGTSLIMRSSIDY